jgi:hypothetical protein
MEAYSALAELKYSTGRNNLSGNFLAGLWFLIRREVLERRKQI